MPKVMLAVAVVFACGLLSGPVLLQERGGEDETGPYEVVPNWPQPLARPGYALGSQGGVFAESPDRIILVNRGEIKLPDTLPNNFTGAYGSVRQERKVPDDVGDPGHRPWSVQYRALD